MAKDACELFPFRECANPGCREGFRPTRRWQRFCSEQCRNKTYTGKAGKPFEKLEAACANCGTIFNRSREWQKYCSKDCKREGTLLGKKARRKVRKNSGENSGDASNSPVAL